MRRPARLCPGSRAWWSVAVVAVLVSAWSDTTRAFVLRPDPPGRRLAMNLNLQPTTTFQTRGYGFTTWNALAAAALAEWNAVGIGSPPDPQFFSVRAPTVSSNPCAPSPDGVNEVRFAATVCGLSWDDAIGVTLTWSIAGRVIEADVLFKTPLTLDAYPGPVVGANGDVLYDFYRLALHEFGHAAGLLHPNLDGGQSVVAVMNSGNQVPGGPQSAVDHLQPDDVGGARAIAWSGGALLAAVLPSSRSVRTGVPATAFATIINIGSVTATQCSISPSTSLAASFQYQTTDPATNALTGTLDTPVSIPPGAAQTFVFAFTPTAAFAPTDTMLDFACANVGPAATFVGLNTLLLSASTTPIPDIVALAATLANDGIVDVLGVRGSGLFAVATVNVGAGGVITASADTGGVPLPIAISVCQTDPATGVCLGPQAASVTTTIGAGETPTFGVFVAGTGHVPFAPAANRIYVRFRDSDGVTRGATSVAVRTR